MNDGVRTVLIELDIRVVQHDPGYGLTEEALAALVASMVTTLPKRIALGEPVEKVISRSRQPRHQVMLGLEKVRVATMDEGAASLITSAKPADAPAEEPARNGQAHAPTNRIRLLEP
jgi:hypothetical protein